VRWSASVVTDTPITRASSASAVSLGDVSSTSRPDGQVAIPSRTSTVGSVGGSPTTAVTSAHDMPIATRPNRSPGTTSSSIGSRHAASAHSSASALTDP
jgi:hypothetical protein